MDKEFVVDYNSNMEMSDMLIKYNISLSTYFKLLKNLNLKRCRRNTVTNRLLNLCNIPITSTSIVKHKLPNNIKVIDHNIPKVPIVNVTKNSITDTMDELLQRSKNTINECNINTERRKNKKILENKI
jgi:hypothetical protein